MQAENLKRPLPQRERVSAGCLGSDGAGTVGRPVGTMQPIRTTHCPPYLNHIMIVFFECCSN